MTDLGNGNYTYTFAVVFGGQVSIMVFLEKAAGVYGVYYNNNNFGGNPAYGEITTNINFNWGGGNVGPYLSDEVTAIFRSNLIPTISGTYLINMIHDDGAKFLFDGVQQYDLLGTR